MSGSWKGRSTFAAGAGSRGEAGRPALARRRAFALALALVAGACRTAPRPPPADVAASPLPAAPCAATEPGPSTLATPRSIAALEGVVRAPGDAPTTAELGRRQAPGRLELPDGLAIETRCGPTWCVDGLSAGGIVLLAPEPSAEDAEWVEQGWLERVVRVAFWDDAVVSAYVAESSFSEGAAHAQNRLRCRTFDRASGRVLSLGDVLPAEAAERVLEKARGLFDDEVALVELGDVLGDVRGKALEPEGFRLGRTPGSNRERPEIVLCAEGDAFGAGGTLLELRLEAMPVGYLLR